MAALKKMLELYDEVLEERMGLDIAVDGPAVTFRIPNGPVATIYLYEEDPEFLSVVTFVTDLEVDVTPEDMRVICMKASSDLKGVKITTDEEGRDITFATEMVVAHRGSLPTADHLQAVLPRAFDMIKIGIERVATDTRFSEIVDQG